MGRASLGDEFRLGHRFEEVRRTLLEGEFADRLTQPLGYWVLPSDRRLPIAFLDRTLNDLLATPFHELSDTPGIGQKKIESLLKLLDRAVADRGPSGEASDSAPNGLTRGSAGGVPSAKTRAERGTAEPRFDPAVVSEAVWAEWRRVVRQHGIGDETLGRLAPSLQRLPTVIWHSTLQSYLDFSVAQIRNLRTHGEKRVRCVLEVFHWVYYRLQEFEARRAEATSNFATSDETVEQRRSDLYCLLTPPWIRQVQEWVDDCRSRQQIPSSDEIRQRFVQPLLEQISIDSGETVHRLASDRLGVAGAARSVRDQARSLGVTRARVYQLLDDCNRIMNVRWPEGREQLDRLYRHFMSCEHDHQTLRLFFSLRDLCFPTKHPDHSAGSESATMGSIDDDGSHPPHEHSTSDADPEAASIGSDRSDLEAQDDDSMQRVSSRRETVKPYESRVRLAHFTD